MILKEIQRVLKPNGILYINDFLLNEDKRNIHKYKEYYDKYSTYGVFELPDGAILRHHSEKRVEEWVKDYDSLVYKRGKFLTMNGNGLTDWSI